MNSAAQIDAFCAALLGGPDGLGDDRLDGWSTYVWTLDKGRPRPAKTTTWVPATPGTLATAIHTEVRRQPDQIAAVYFSLGMAPDTVIHERVARRDSQAPMHRRRFEAADVMGITGLWSDIDILGPGHAGTLYPPDQRAALEVAHSIGLPPSCVVHSGGGLQPYWFLTEPWLATDATDPIAEQVAMADLSRNLVSTLRHHAQRLGGWTVDSVFNLDRVMRAPGGLNTKNDGATPVTLLSLDAGVRYEPDQIREHLAPDDVLAQYAQKSISGASAAVVEQSLPGLDLAAAWQVASTAPDHLPEWLEMLLEADPGSDLEATWTGERSEYGGDQNRFDAALVRLLADAGASAQRQAEAVMARRLRSGQKTDKVDPRVRTDYVVRTLINVGVPASEAATRAKAIATRRISQLNTAASEAVTARLIVATPAPTVVAMSVPAATGAEPPPDPLDEEVSGDPVDELADAVAELIAPEPIVTPERPPRHLAAATETVRADREQREQGKEQPADDPWGTRSTGTVEVMQALTEALLADGYRKRGIQVWRLEQRDRGPAALGRLVLALPEDFDWPEQARPDLYRPGRPFYTEWRKRQEFETAAGYRRSIEHDAKLTALPVAVAQDEWPSIIANLVPYWGPDSSGTDMTTQVHTWLYEYLTGRAPTLEDGEALSNGHPWLAAHADWGLRGAPQIMVLAQSFLDYIGTQPGGRTGREARSLLDHLHTEERRPRIQQHDGVMTRHRWLEISATEFRHPEWKQILTVAQQAHEARKLRVLKGGAS